MGLETGTYIGDLDATNPVGATDKRHQGDDHLRLIKSVLKATLPNATKAFRFPSILSKTANYTVLSSDDNSTILCNTTTGAITLTLPTLASGDAGWMCRIIKTSTDVNAVNLSGTINGESSMSSTTPYEVINLVWNGTNWNAWVGSNGFKVTSITGNLTVTEDYLDGLILSVPAASNRTITLPASAGYRGRALYVHHTGNTYSTTLDANASETINGALTQTLSATNQVAILVSDGTNWVMLASTASTTDVLTGTDASKSATPDAIAALWEQGADVASAATITLGDGGYFNITGTTGISDIDFTTDKAGRRVWLKFASALTLTHNATTLILPAGANITTAAGDTAEFISEGSDVVRCVSYQRADGSSVSAAGMTLLGTLTTTSGTTQSLTGIGSSYRRLYIEIAGVSFNAAATMSIAISSDNGTNYGTAVSIAPGTSTAARSLHGAITVDNIQATDAFVPAYSNICLDSAPGVALTPSAVGLAVFGGGFGPVNAIRFAGGTFDAGTIRVYGIK